MNAADLKEITGEHLLFLGIGTYTWTLQQFQDAARFARQHDVSTLLVKTNEGALPAWYDGIGGWKAVKRVIQNEGVGAIPYIFSYGNKFGDLDIEIDAMLSYMQNDGVVCMNAEKEWNNDVASAKHLCYRITSESRGGTFLVSTWADPSLQNWSGVVRELAPCTTAFMPQQYNNYLASFWAEFGNNGALFLQPTVNLTQDFGPNDPVAIARAAYSQGHTAISVWYYETAVANPGLLDAVYAAFPKGGSTPVQQYGPNSGDFDNWFTVDSNSNWLCKAFNTVVMGGNKALYSQVSIDGNTLPIIGLPRTNEIYQQDTDGYSWSVQFFERGLIVYDPAHRKDSQPGLNASYFGKYSEFMLLDPAYQPVTIEKIPSSVAANIKLLAIPVAQLIAATQ